MRAVYNNLYGVEEYQAMLTELTESFRILKEKGASDIIRKTNYVFAVDHGCGFTTLLSAF